MAYDDIIGNDARPLYISVKLAVGCRRRKTSSVIEVAVLPRFVPKISHSISAAVRNVISLGLGT
jgi:hypothetical protein